jgi:hypothetical protein
VAGVSDTGFPSLPSLAARSFLVTSATIASGKSIFVTPPDSVWIPNFCNVSRACGNRCEALYFEAGGTSEGFPCLAPNPLALTQLTISQSADPSEADPNMD